MLTTLNTLLLAVNAQDDARVLWHDLDKGRDINLATFRQDLSALRCKLAVCDHPRWLLYSTDPYFFLLGLLVLLGLKRQVIISANRQPEWLRGLGSAFDAILCDEVLCDELLSEQSISECSSIAVADGSNEQRQVPLKPCFDFSALPQGCMFWQPVFDGSEVLMFFTSGSTGQPKAIAKTLLALTNEVTTLAATFEAARESSLFIASVSHLHIYGLLFRILLPLLTRTGSLRQMLEYQEQFSAIAGRFPPSMLTKAVFISSPTFLSRLDPQLPPESLRLVFSSGGPLTFAAAVQSRQQFGTLPVEVYGSTETGGIGYRQQEDAMTAWTPFAGVEFCSTENSAALTSPHLPGQPPIELDDRLEFFADGRFLMKGRKDRIIKLAEKRISLTDIERFMEALPAVAQCVALVLTGKRDTLGCVIALSEVGTGLVASLGQRMLIQRWKTAMQTRFEAAAIPRRWRIVSTIPVNSQSKIDQSLLLSLFAKSPDTP